MSKARRRGSLNALWATAGFLFAACCGAQAGNASPRSLEQLLRDVTQERVAEHLENKEREQRFLEIRKQRQAILDEAKRTLLEEQAEADRLKQQFDADDALIQEKTKVLQASQGSVGELHRIVRQSASDLTAITESSLVSAEFPEETAFLRRLSQSQEFPSIDDLEKLWYALLQHLVESGKVSQFKAKIVNREGTEKERLVTRAGTFNVIADGEFLRYQPSTKRLLVPVHQPRLRVQSLVRVFETSDQELCELPIDPTRGASLELLLQQPGFLENEQRKGVIGYAIIALGLAALLVVANYPALSALAHKVRRRSREPKRDDAAPFGWITKGDADNPHLAIDRAVMKEPPAVRRSLSMAAIVGLAVLINLLLFYLTNQLATSQPLKPSRYETLRPVTFIRMPKPEEAQRRQREQPPQKPKPQREPALPKMAVVDPQKPEMQRPKIAAPRAGLASIQIAGDPYLGDFQPMEDAAGFSGTLELDTSAVPVVRVDPPYPPRALRAGIEGSVIVEFTITAAGGVNDPVIAKADPPGIFDQAVLAVITKWKFKPRISAGTAVARRARQTVEFSMQD
ncbi:MAG: TonB family protein [Gammaproteobacteria bacterium]